MSSCKITSRYLRLKDNHPTMVKLNKLIDLANELGISLTFTRFACSIQDKDCKIPNLRLKDIENDHMSSDRQQIDCFPYEMEFVIIGDNPDYIER